MSKTTTKPEWAQSAHDKCNAERIAAGLKPRRRIAPWIVLGLVAAGAGGFLFLNPTPEAALAPVAAEDVIKQIRSAETTRLAPMTLRETVKVNGTLVPSRQADVAAQVSAQVLNVLVRPGDAVEAGQVLVELDRKALEIQLGQDMATAEATRAQLVSAEQQLVRSQELADQRLATTASLEQARSAAENLRSSLAALDEVVKSAQLALTNATIVAPMDGVVSGRTVEPGQLVAAGTSLLTVVNLDVMEYQASATVSASAAVAAGQAVSLTVAGLESRALSGIVTRVNPVATAGTRTIPIYIAVDNPDHTLRGGMFATGQVAIVEKTDAIAVPSAALREDGLGPYLLGLADGTVTRQSVEPGTRWNNGLLIEVSGIETGALLVTTPLSGLDAGDRFTLIEE